ncbi:EexN family lipoprotein [Xanthomonas arboricola]|uniref:EexN family lipoprotein n=1 Tax=Xanthomonas arboricola TaxID=56448 RepID=UPI001CBB1022|nr:EexN family lipoprotein [Xanthomonas arboricola]MDN0293103.1 EexN family lipoprotein [Xanthomonas arboricola pv. pruni]
MQIIKPLIVALILVSVASCKQDPLAPARDVAHFKAHPDERADVLAKCEADPGQLKEHPNCVNARQAQWDESMKSNDNAVPRLPARN